MSSTTADVDMSTGDATEPKRGSRKTLSKKQPSDASVSSASKPKRSRAEKSSTSTTSTTAAVAAPPSAPPSPASNAAPKAPPKKRVRRAAPDVSVSTVSLHAATSAAALPAPVSAPLPNAGVADAAAFGSTWLPWGPIGATTEESWREWSDCLKAMLTLPYKQWEKLKRAADKEAKKSQSREKRVDAAATTRAHAARISELPDEEFAKLDNKWLTAFYGKEKLTAAELGTDAGAALAAAEQLDAKIGEAVTVYAVALSKGVTPLGIMPCNKAYTKAYDAAALSNCVYVGKKMDIGACRAEKSIFSRITEDVHKTQPAKASKGKKAAGAGAGTGAGNTDVAPADAATA
jgi:hypothetical protein